MHPVGGQPAHQAPRETDRPGPDRAPAPRGRPDPGRAGAVRGRARRPRLPRRRARATSAKLRNGHGGYRQRHHRWRHGAALHGRRDRCLPPPASRTSAWSSGRPPRRGGASNCCTRARVDLAWITLGPADCPASSSGPFSTCPGCWPCTPMTRWPRGTPSAPATWRRFRYLAYPESSTSRQRLEENFARLGDQPPRTHRHSRLGHRDPARRTRCRSRHPACPAPGSATDPAGSRVRTVPIPALDPLTVGWAARQWNLLSPPGHRIRRTRHRQPRQPRRPSHGAVNRSTPDRPTITQNYLAHRIVA